MNQKKRKSREQVKSRAKVRNIGVTSELREAPDVRLLARTIVKMAAEQMKASRK